MNEDNVINDCNEGFNPVTSSLMNPRETIRYVLDKDKKLYYWILLYLYGLSLSMDNVARRDYSLSPIVIVLLFVFAPVSGLISTYFYSWIMSIFGNVFGGKASYEELRISLLWSSVPIMMIIPIAFVTFLGGATNVKHIVYSSTFFTIGYWLLVFVEITIGIWCFVNLVRMVSEVQGFSKTKSFFSIILPAVIVLTLVFGVMFFLFFTTKNTTAVHFMMLRS